MLELNIWWETVEVGSDWLTINYKKRGSRWSRVKARVIEDLTLMLWEDFSGRIHVQYACPEKRRSTEWLLIFPQATGTPGVVDLHVSLTRDIDTLAPFIKANGLDAGLNFLSEVMPPNREESRSHRPLHLPSDFFQQ